MKNSQRAIAIVLIIALATALFGCSQPVAEPSELADPVDVQQAEFDDIAAAQPGDGTVIALDGSSATSDGGGCRIDGSTVTITKGGVYSLSGSLRGQVIVDADGEKVRLVLSGADIVCANSSPIYIKDAKRVIITLAPGTENTLTDGEEYDYGDAQNEEPSAALFSKADLILEGEGSLTVNGNSAGGIQSKDTLEIHGGIYSITAAGHGITGKDSLAVKGGVFKITAGGDAMRSNNSDSNDVGWISIGGGEFTINAGQDGIQAESTLYIGAGQFDIVTGGGSANSSASGDGWGNWQPGGNMDGGHGRPSGESASAGSAASSDSAKALKAGSDVLIEGGAFLIDSSDDALHSNGNLAITGGAFTLSSGDDGIHANSRLTISSGEITILKSCEGLEGVSMAISGGVVKVNASDDGLNSAGGSDGDSFRPGANQFANDTSCNVDISGGTVIVDADGDGIDSNGSINISGGVLLVSGPTNDGNGALDYNGDCVISGGTMIIAGSSGMAQGAGGSSTQVNVLIGLDGTVESGTLLSLTDASGRVIVAFTPAKRFSSVLFSSPDMKTGEEYTLYSGGKCSGESENGLYTDGALTSATALTTIALTKTCNSVGSVGGMGFGRR